MSTVVDAILSSDNPNLDLAAAVGRNGVSKTPNARRSVQPSSPRPYGPPSESNGALSDVEGFPDDEVVGIRGTDRNRPRDPMARAVPKVVDKVGEKVAEEFENFLEQYALEIEIRYALRLTSIGLSKTSHRQEPLHQVP